MCVVCLFGSFFELFVCLFVCFCFVFVARYGVRAARYDVIVCMACYDVRVLSVRRVWRVMMLGFCLCGVL